MRLYTVSSPVAPCRSVVNRNTGNSSNPALRQAAAKARRSIDTRSTAFREVSGTKRNVTPQEIGCAGKRRNDVRRVQSERAGKHARVAGLAEGRQRAASSTRSRVVRSSIRAKPASDRRRARTRSRPVPPRSSPSSASANVDPIVGCPAIGSSSAGVKMRIRTSPVPSAGKTKVDSEKFISAAIRCIKRGRDVARWLQKDRELVALERRVGEDVVVEVA